MKKSLIALILFLGCLVAGKSQNYESAIGLRLGDPWALSYKNFVNEKTAFEGYIGFRNFPTYSEMRINGAFLSHQKISSVEGLNWYYGVGLGAVFYHFKTNFTGLGGGVSIAASGYIGVEYKLKEIPLLMAIDWVPTFHIGGFDSGFEAGLANLAIRYVLK